MSTMQSSQNSSIMSQTQEDVRNKDHNAQDGDAGGEPDVVLTADDVEEVIEDDGEVGEAMDEDEEAVAAGDAEPMIKDEPGEPRERPDNGWAGTFLHKPGSSIFALALHPNFPNPPLAVSGGQDDLGYLFCPIPAYAYATPAEVAAYEEGQASSSKSRSVWAGDPPEGTFTRHAFPPIALNGHTDSVVAAAFSTDGEYVATGGMDGRVRVWGRVKRKRGPPVEENSPEAWKTWTFITSLEAGTEVQWLTWHPKGNVLAAGCEDATVWMWQIPSGRTMTVLSSHTMSCTAGVFPPPAGRQLLTASLDSSLVLWNPSQGVPDFKMSVFCPSGARFLDPSMHGITSLAISPSGNLVAVGGAGGRVRLVAFARGEVVDRPAEIVNTLEGHARGESVEAVAFVDLLRGAEGGKGIVLVSAGTDGRVVVWDTTTGRIRAQMRHPEAVTALATHPAPSQFLITTACLDRTLRTWDIRTGTLVAEHVGHAGPVTGVAVANAPEGQPSPLGLAQPQLVISAGDEGASLVWRI